MKAVIVDDENKSIENLTLKLDSLNFDIDIIKVFNDPVLAIKYINTNKPDILFLDIEMPNYNGFTLLDKVKDITDIKIVFVTAFDNYALKAFRYSAFDYLLKPVDMTLLKSTLEKYTTHQNAQTKEQFDILKQLIFKQNSPKKIPLESMEKIRFIAPKNIIYCKAESNYTKVILQNSVEILVSKTLKEIEKLLSPFQFYRIHHGVIINLEEVKEFQKSENSVILSSGVKLPVSRTRKKSFFSVLANQ